MPYIERGDNEAVIQKFGGGVHTRASEEDIMDRESGQGGENYRLDPSNREFRPRKGFDYIVTAPDGNAITGMINLVKQDEVKMAVSTAGGNVYEYTGGVFGAPIATGLDVNAKLRGRIEHNVEIDGVVIVTDVAGQEVLYEWDGATFSPVAHNLTGDLRAKYAFVSDERLWLGNVHNNGNDTPHAVIASQVDDYKVLSTTKPTSALGDGDPFWLLMPDLRPINGMVEAYGRRVFSTSNGQISELTGDVGSNFKIDDFYPRSGASGDESLLFIGNDIVYGRRGRIESLRATDQFGDVESNDMSQLISDDIEKYINWTNVYNSRTQQVLFIPENQSLAWNYSKPVAEKTELSPWVKYTTKHSMGFNPTCIMNMIDPDDGLEYVFMGDADGNFYRLEGEQPGDAGEDISSVFVGQLKSMPTTGNMANFDGYIRYRKDISYDVNVTFIFSGRRANDETIQVNIEEDLGGSFYGQNIYYGGNNYYGGQLSGRLFEKYIGQVGQGEAFQVKLQIETKADFRVNEVGFRFQTNFT